MQLPSGGLRAPALVETVAVERCGWQSEAPVELRGNDGHMRPSCVGA